MVNSSALVLDPTDRSTERQQVQVLIQRMDAGQTISASEVEQFVHSYDPATRGLAKRLLALLVVQSAKERAAELLDEACADLDYRHPALLTEAWEASESVGRAEHLHDRWVAAALSATQRGRHDQALALLKNAVVVDFRCGGRQMIAPSKIRNIMRVYEHVATATRAPCGIQPAPRHQRRSPADGKLRLAHVTCQLFDTTHSPSRCVDTLLRYADPQFDTHLFITESLGHYTNLVGQLTASPWTRDVGMERVRKIQEQYGIRVVIPTERTSPIAAAAELHRQFAEHAIDVAFFHGSIATSVDWLLCHWRAAPWQFDRGLGMPLFCPGVDHQFFEYRETMEELAFFCREHNIPYTFSLDLGADVDDVVHAEPVSRTALGLGPDRVVLGTIGNHLPRRMSPQFCSTISQVLRACPQAVYLIIGDGDFNEQRAAFGRDLCGGSAPRILFLGARREPDRWTQTFDIYVNEYPEGGGIAVAEAVAAGKPVVCMRVDKTGPALAGGFFVGKDNLVQPATNDAYAVRLATLIRNPEERVRMGRALRARYERVFDARKLVHEVTDDIAQFVHGNPIKQRPYDEL